MATESGAETPFSIPVEMRLRGEIPSDRLADAFLHFKELAAASSLDVQFLNPGGEAIQAERLLAGDVVRPRTASHDDFIGYGRQIGLDDRVSGKSWHKLAKRFYFRSIGAAQEDYDAADAPEARSLVFPVVFETFDPKSDYRKSTVTGLNVASLGTYLGYVESALRNAPAGTKPTDIVGMDVGDKTIEFWKGFYRYWQPGSSEE